MDFLLNEAISTYIVGLIALFSGIIGYFISKWINRIKPRIIQIIKDEEHSLVNVDQKVRDEIKVFFREEEINSLFLTKLVIRNNSNDTIENIGFQVWLKSPAEILKILAIDVGGGEFYRKHFFGAAPENERILDSNIELLNSYKVYKDQITISIYSKKPIVVDYLNAGGNMLKFDFIDNVERVRLGTEKKEGFFKFMKK